VSIAISLRTKVKQETIDNRLFKNIEEILDSISVMENRWDMNEFEVP